MVLHRETPQGAAELRQGSRMQLAEDASGQVFSTSSRIPFSAEIREEDWLWG